jgi:hypothetical protein
MNEHEELVLAAAVSGSLPPEPLSVKEALASPEAELWREALREEFAAIKAMNVYKLIPRSSVPAGRRILKGKPVFKRKLNESGEVTRYKARWVAKGFLQIFGQDFEETTSPTARMESIRILAHIAAVLNYEIRQFDVKTAFLHGTLDTPVYMEQPPGFEEALPSGVDGVWQLVKGLYGLKQGGLCWNIELHKAMLEMGFTQVLVEHCVYVRRRDNDLVIAAVHVDDFKAISSSVASMDTFEADLKSRYEISTGDGSFLLGIHSVRDREARTIHLSQTAMIDRVVVEFGQQDWARPMSTPMDDKAAWLEDDCIDPSDRKARAAVAHLPYGRLVGSLTFLAIATRADIAYAVNFLSRFLHNFSQKHYDAAIRIVRYLKFTRTHGLLLGRGKDLSELIVVDGMTDSDYANDKIGRRSVSGYCFSLGAGAISWRSKRQACVAQSTCEAEYVAASAAAKEAVWLRQLLSEIGYPQEQPTLIRGDNQGALELIKSQRHHEQAKHIDVRYHYVREEHKKGTIRFDYVRLHNNVADLFTKPLARAVFAPLRRRIGIVPPTTDAANCNNFRGYIHRELVGKSPILSSL